MELFSDSGSVQNEPRALLNDDSILAEEPCGGFPKFGNYPGTPMEQIGPDQSL